MSESNNRGRVVVGVDGSAGSLTALDFAFDDAKRRGTGLLVVSAFDLPDVWSLTSGLPVSCTVEEIQQSVLQNTRRVVAEALGDRMTADGAPDVEVVARGGGAAHVLVSAAVGSPLLVVGSRGLGGFRRMLLGSVSLTCVLHALCPVTVVRSAADPDRAATSELSGAPAAIL
ncbi:MAG: universal stress protein [Pseudonocardiaceae bacterium]